MKNLKKSLLTVFLYFLAILAGVALGIKFPTLNPSILMSVILIIIMPPILIYSVKQGLSISKVYRDIADQHGWQYEKRTKGIPSSIITLYGDCIKRKGRAPLFAGRGAAPAVIGEYNFRKFVILQYFEIVYRKHFSYTLVGAAHKGIHGSAYIFSKRCDDDMKKRLLYNLSIFGQLPNVPDIKIEEPQFDSMFRIKSDYPIIKEVLDTNIRQKLLNITSQYKWEGGEVLEINQNEVIFASRIIIADKDFLLAMIDLVTSIANNTDKY